MRKAALELGVEIFENTEMTELKYGEPATVVTAQGSVKAKQVVLALNAWMVDKFKEFKNSIVVVSSDMVITKQVLSFLRNLSLRKG
ncbi:O-acetylhomoserine sulfhydrylase [Vibrio sp. JCM 19236]|nr:O-acetylhomoserine sulfhydrylase [Vibrio sp. JCM 19236]